MTTATCYYGSQQAGTAQQYYQEAANLAGNDAAAGTATDTQWLPLGVFGLLAQGKKTPDMVFQLAVDKNGVIRGNYFDQTTQTNLPVTGSVDKRTQRVAWSVGSGKGIFVETGLYNLTQDEAERGPLRSDPDGARTAGPGQAAGIGRQ